MEFCKHPTSQAEPYKIEGFGESSINQDTKLGTSEWYNDDELKHIASEAGNNICGDWEATQNSGTGKDGRKDGKKDGKKDEKKDGKKDGADQNTSPGKKGGISQVQATPSPHKRFRAYVSPSRPHGGSAASEKINGGRVLKKMMKMMGRAQRRPHRRPAWGANRKRANQSHRRPRGRHRGQVLLLRRLLQRRICQLAKC